MTEDEFADRLDGLVAEARDADVRVEGTHNVRSPRPDDPDYTVEISALATRTPDWARG